MSDLRIGKVGRKVFKLPLAVATEASAVFGIRGTGKTVTGKKIVEQLLGKHAQVVIIDPTDAWWGLKSSADGKSAAFPIHVLGGEQADMPLSPLSGTAVAEFVTHQRASVVLSLSLMDVPDQKRFVAEFSERLYRLKAKQRNRTPVLVVIDEASMVVPQTRRDGGRKDYGARASLAVTALVRRGRSRGVGVLIIDQRPATVHKDVTTQASMLICHAATGKRDVDALREWVELNDTGGRRAEFEAGLARLDVGHAWFWLPRADIFERVAVEMVETFDSSATPEYGEDPILPETLAEVDIEALREHMAEAVAEAEANDPEILKRNLSKARAEIRKLQATKPDVDPEVVAAAKQRGREEAFAELEKLRREIRSKAAQITDAARKAEQCSGQILAVTESEFGGAVSSGRQQERSQPPAPVVARQGRQSRGAARRAPTVQRATAPATSNGAVTRSQQRVLDALAAFENLGQREPTRPALAAIARYKQGGHFNNLISSLNTAGLLHYPADGSVALTEAGRELATSDLLLATVEDVHAAWLDVCKGNPQRIVLQALIDRYPDGVDRDELAEMTSYSPGGHFNNIVSRLRTMGAAWYPSKGSVAATDLLFPGGLA